MIELKTKELDAEFKKEKDLKDHQKTMFKNIYDLELSIKKKKIEDVLVNNNRKN